jgi:ankyrin repeat protein
MNGNTPLHLAAASGYTQTMIAILNIHGHLMDVTNKKLVSFHRVFCTSLKHWLEVLSRVAVSFCKSDDKIDKICLEF